MKYILCVAIFWSLLKSCLAGGCNDYTGYRYLNDPDLAENEDDPSDTGLLVDLQDSGYKIECSCGIVTKWEFFARKNGTVILYVLDESGNVRGYTSVHVPNFFAGGGNNHYELPVSSEMWIPVQQKDRLAFFTEGYPMITFQNGTSSSQKWNTGQVFVDTGGNVAVSSEGDKSDNRYAVAAYIEEAHEPMFVNAPFTVTIFTHDYVSSPVIFTATVLDLDGTDILDVTMNGTESVKFTLTDISNDRHNLAYTSLLAAGDYELNLYVTDGCHPPVPTVVTVKIINERPRFTELPASITIEEDSTTVTPLLTLSPNDPSSDSVTCSLASSTQPFNMNANSIEYDGTGLEFATKKFYDIVVNCNDGVSTVTSNFQVDVIKNEPPSYNSGVLPGWTAVDRSSEKTIYTLNATDPNGDTLVFTRDSCTSLNGISCDSYIEVSSTGNLTTEAVLDDVGYDVGISVTDNKGNTVGPYYLSVLTSEDPYTFESPVTFVNLDATIHVLEGTAEGTYLYKVMYLDENPTENFTLTATANATTLTHFDFNTSTGIVTTKDLTSYDFDTEASNVETITITVDDGLDSNITTTATGTITFSFVNVNEGLEPLSLSSPTFTISETAVTGDEVGTIVAFANDIDGDTVYYTMDCGDDSKYFYFNPSDKKVYLAREYDMDLGLSGTATCEITARDAGGFSLSDNITITIEETNDNSPAFPHLNYVFIQSPSDPFFTFIADMTASDGDINDTPDTLTYMFNRTEFRINDTLDTPTYTFANTTEISSIDPADVFQIDADALLYVRDVSNFSQGDFYSFEIISSDTEGRNGTCTVTVIFSGVATTTTTTTERVLVFADDPGNYFWLFLIGVIGFCILVAVLIIVCRDPPIYEYVTKQMYRFSNWCRRKPKPKVPRRTVGKLTVTVNRKTLENDPDNALPWELLAKDNDVPEVNAVQESIHRRQEQRDRDYKNVKGLAVFEKGKGARPDSSRSGSSASIGRSSESPQYAKFVSKADGGEGQWGDLS